MTTQDTLNSFVELFRGRGDAYGHEEGRCVKQPLTHDVFRRHLDGTEPIGVYPMVPYRGEYFVVWGCSDIDVDDLAAARSIQQALQAAGVFAWVERSRSKGYHVWVFASEPVPASAMRRMLLCAHQVADYPAREVNPKQETLATNQYGNYVRLPYWNAADLGALHRRVLDDNDQPMPLQDFVKQALLSRTPAEIIKRLAALWTPPAQPAHVVVDIAGDETLDDAMNHLSPLGKVIWRDGPLPERDRSSTLTKLAHECFRSNMPPSMCKIILKTADKRWGKYHLRFDGGETELDKLVMRAYS